MIDLKKYRKLKKGEIRHDGDIYSNGVSCCYIGLSHQGGSIDVYRLRKKPCVSSKINKSGCVSKKAKKYIQRSEYVCENSKSYALPSKEFIQPVRVWICQPYWCNAIGTNYIFSDRCKATQIKFLAGKGSRRMFQAIIIPIKPQRITPILRKK